MLALVAACNDGRSRDAMSTGAEQGGSSSSGVDADDDDPRTCDERFADALLACREQGGLGQVLLCGVELRLVPLDDPSVRVRVSGGWLVEAEEDELLGWDPIECGRCQALCMACQPSQSLCTHDLTNDGHPQGCTFCMPPGASDPVAACEQVLSACTD